MSAEAPTEPDDGAATRLVITRGGAPAAEHLAALVVALTPSAAPPAEATVPPWRRAALLEGVGSATVLAPADLDDPAHTHRR